MGHISHSMQCVPFQGMADERIGKTSRTKAWIHQNSQSSRKTDRWWENCCYKIHSPFSINSYVTQGMLLCLFSNRYPNNSMEKNTFAYEYILSLK